MGQSVMAGSGGGCSVGSRYHRYLGTTMRHTCRPPLAPASAVPALKKLAIAPVVALVRFVDVDLDVAMQRVFARQTGLGLAPEVKHKKEGSASTARGASLEMTVLYQRF